MKENNAPKAIKREDYSAPVFTIDKTVLEFDLGENSTVVNGDFGVRRVVSNQAAEASGALVLDGVELELLSVAIDGEVLDITTYEVDESSLTIHSIPDECNVQISTRINPAGNKALEGLYQSSGNFCTQCEAQGFRKIIYFLDRPDVLSTFEVTIKADKKQYPVLLANGNPVSQGDLEQGRHFVTWQDPFVKPCYLFALVAGDLQYIQDRYVTTSGREIDLRIYVEEHNIAKCDYAMVSLIKSMKWDEEVYGLEYDLDIFMIVAVDDFNMGAMENKGLNIFNSKFVLADAETATDSDFMGIESVIAHEYFHNWTGNRVTCRDWFQLSLKEGLTVFRDQEFSADLNSRAVNRIGNVGLLRARQFPEDAGPMAHPIRPDSYMEINNFYTVTVYEKGAEVIRMIHTLLGADKFRKGMDLYFERFDGQAVTCDDFVDAMQDASEMDLVQFRRWYAQAGTPVLTVNSRYDTTSKQYTLEFSQACKATPGQPHKDNFVLPVRLALFDQTGQALSLQTASTGIAVSAESKEGLLQVLEQKQSITFDGIKNKPIPSLLRNFSAPVVLEIDYEDQELAFLLAHENDTFNRWDAGQRMAKRVIEQQMLQDPTQQHSARQHSPQAASNTTMHVWLEAMGSMLEDNSIDPALRAEMLAIPDIDSVAETHEVIDVEQIDQARKQTVAKLVDTYRGRLLQLYQELDVQSDYKVDAHSIGQRSLKNTCLSLLSQSGQNDWLDLACEQYSKANNMTDRAIALRLVCDHAVPQRDQLLIDFYQRYEHEKLVIDKWFACQAMSGAEDTIDRIDQLMAHEAFTLENPNRVRSLIGVFAMSNIPMFHSVDGRGYRLLTGVVLKLDSDNPQVAARLAGALSRWRRYSPEKQTLMTKELARIRDAESLSADVFEIVSKSLG